MEGLCALSGPSECIWCWQDDGGWQLIFACGSVASISYRQQGSSFSLPLWSHLQLHHSTEVGAGFSSPDRNAFPAFPKWFCP